MWGLRMGVHFASSRELRALRLIQTIPGIRPLRFSQLYWNNDIPAKSKESVVASRRGGDAIAGGLMLDHMHRKGWLIRDCEGGYSLNDTGTMIVAATKPKENAPA